ncbi:SE1561 family protein [Bacillus sp. FJAT-44742]|uniref:SE1561 family protein n=1 Tax=Bacillus sp. FJAT-44742 TaxID=2014005 RepID=UPI000C234B95|nr:SE1561 family protein [Bacillus sp. FJAT-44742]
MGSPVYDKVRQLEYLQKRVELMSHMLEALDPSEADINDLNRFQEMLDQVKIKTNQFQKNWE